MRKLLFISVLIISFTGMSLGWFSVGGSVGGGSSDVTLSDVLGNGNSAESYDIDLSGNNITQSGGNISFTESLKVYDSNGVYVQGADLAEQYRSRERLEKGEIVKISDKYNNSVKSTDRRFEPNAGVVSTQPGYILSYDARGRTYPVALTGKVPVKVNTENGEIERGDRIIPSSTPGVGMRCEIKPLDETENFEEYRDRAEQNRKCRDSTVGKALEPADQKTKILVKMG